MQIREERGVDTNGDGRDRCKQIEEREERGGAGRETCGTKGMDRERG